jgi:hypothetical protein
MDPGADLAVTQVVERLPVPLIGFRLTPDRAQKTHGDRPIGVAMPARVGGQNADQLDRRHEFAEKQRGRPLAFAAAEIGFQPGGREAADGRQDCADDHRPKGVSISPQVQLSRRPRASEFLQNSAPRVEARRDMGA